MATDRSALEWLREAEDAIRELRTDSDSPAIPRLETAIARLIELASNTSEDTLG